MYKKQNIKIKSFRLTTNKNINGRRCAIDNNHFIDYNEECYYQSELNIYICKACRQNNKDKLTKYHNVPQSYNGSNYQSKLESEYAKQLDLQVRAGLIKEWKRQVKIEINCIDDNGIPILTDEPLLELKRAGKTAYHITNYYIDFVVINNDDSLKYVETKGYETELWKLKWKLAEQVLRDKVEMLVLTKKTGKKYGKSKPN